MGYITHTLRRLRRLGLSALVHWGLLGLVVVMVLYPVVLILTQSFQTARPGQAAPYSFEAWQMALSNPSLLLSLWNTFTLTVVRQAIALPIAVLVAWILARTDVPGSRWLEFLFWIAFFLPGLPVTLGWIMLLDPQYGLLNKLVTFLPFVDQGPFNIYSFWGIVWTHLATSSIAIKVMLLTPAFRNMDASLEEAARVSGANNFLTIVRVVLPVMTPVLTVVVLLSIIYSLQTFELELILGFPIRFFVFSTQIYFLLHQEPPLFPVATALSSMMLGFIVPLIIVQRWASERRSYQTVGGQFKGHKMRLRRLRMPAFFSVLCLGLVTTVIPLSFLMLGTFMKLFGFFNLAQPWTLMHWNRVFDDPTFLTSIWNTMLLGGGTALANVVLCTAVGYTVVRSSFVGRAALDFTSWLPATLPGIILGVGLLWLFLGTPLLRELYGTIAVMVIASIIATMTTAVQIIKSNFAQLGHDLEEAARVSGAAWWYAFRYVLLPLITPTLLLVGALSFISAARNVSTVVLLSTTSTRPLSLLQLDFMVEGRYESAAVVGVIVVAMTTGLAALVRVLGLRVGLSE